ncbi:50S ribosomal protein L23 [Ammoniphilus sp. CFH 90114]|uniref:50S ribosomal protein L23 n=1 Tax=Ammoniphilus sp. CFH 90114 TaxID=2493665 RepID=UPI00100FB6FA|nr:50S ribosomal protein L23 [Ammoniphilus sp. CFH 90114]RXT05366.1 50S ribosomal protein L23 [Ammoniphilus sp. CFH 90114]
MKDVRDVILRPIITERTTEMMSFNTYVFEVAPKSNKTEIKQAIEKIFDVKVESVNTMNVKGKPKRMGRYVGKRKDWKKAIIKLSADSKALEFFEGV